MVESFRAATGSTQLQTEVCASCWERKPANETENPKWKIELDVSLSMRPDCRKHHDNYVDTDWLKGRGLIAYRSKMTSETMSTLHRECPTDTITSAK